MIEQRSQKSDNDFNDSFVAPPIVFHQQKSIHNKSYQSLSKNFGQLEELKLTRYLTGNSTIDDSDIPLLRQKIKGELISLVTIDADSLVLEKGSDFQNLMRKYWQCDICMVGVTGQKDVGKSFFCDKIYNLAEVQGNNFCQIKQPGIYIWSTPFLKDNLCVFIIQIGGCQIKSAAFRVLTSISMILCSSLIFINQLHQDKNQTSLKEFQKAIDKSLKAFDFSEQSFSNRDNLALKNQGFSEFFPLSIYNLIRNQQQNMAFPSSLQFFPEQIKKYLPNAMTASYKGSKTDMIDCSFLTKQCINPEYLKKVSQIFKIIMSNAVQKKYKQLVINGSIADKLLENMVTKFNSKKKLKMHAIYEQILRDLYISAYNQCVLSYHNQLQQFFSDEKPKNPDSIYQVYDQASKNIFLKFSQYNFHPQMQKEFQRKLQNHIDEKQRIINSVNKQKSSEEINQHLRRKGIERMNAEEAIALIHKERPELMHGRGQAIAPFILQIFKSNKFGNDPQFKKKQEIDKINLQIMQKKNQLAKITALKEGDNKIKEKYQQQKKKHDKIANQVSKKMTEIKQQQDKIERKKRGTEKVQLFQEREQLLLKETEKKKQLAKLKEQKEGQIIKQMQTPLVQKINNLKVRQKEVEKEIEKLQGGPKVMENPEKAEAKKAKNGSASKSNKKTK